jgi:hypothetical protein
MSLSEKQRMDIWKAASGEIATLITENLPEVPDGLLQEADDYFFKCVGLIAGRLKAASSSTGYDPIQDEKKEFTLDEFTSVAMVEVAEYAETWRGENPFHLAKHTWDEWFRSFREYMSW